MRKLFKERKLFKGGNYMRKYGIKYFKSFLNSVNKCFTFANGYVFPFQLFTR